MTIFVTPGFGKRHEKRLLCEIRTMSCSKSGMSNIGKLWDSMCLVRKGATSWLKIFSNRLDTIGVAVYSFDGDLTSTHNTHHVTISSCSGL